MKKTFMYLVGIMFVASLALPFTAIASDPAPAAPAADDAKAKDAGDDEKKDASAEGAEEGSEAKEKAN